MRRAIGAVVGAKIQLTGAPAMATGSIAPAPELQGAPRPSLTSITVHSRDGEVEVTVALSIDGSVFTGTASGPGAPIHRPTDKLSMQNVCMLASMP